MPASFPMLAVDRFAVLDWTVVVIYMAIVVAIGLVAGRRHDQGDAFFLAGRQMPAWAVALSVMATSLSAATFIGGPQIAHRGDLSYMLFKFAGLPALIIVGLLFLPTFYRVGSPSIYGFLAVRFGGSARGAASIAFMIGRLLASGARLFMVAIPFALVAFGSAEGGWLVAAIVIASAVAALYTVMGGVRAVIWTDVLQAGIIVLTIVIAIPLLWRTIDLPVHEVTALLRGAEQGDKLRVVDAAFDWSKPFTVWASMLGTVLFLVAAYGCDQDMTQRLLTCRTPRRAFWAGVWSNLISWPIMLLFLVLGLLLWVEEQVHGPILPDLDDGRDRAVFLRFILRDLPVGVRGLLMAGLFAAAMSSLDSALNALASTTVDDVIRPWRERRGAPPLSASAETRISRVAILGWAIALAGLASACAIWQSASGQALITFALSVMVYAYGGLLGVYATALLTRRGTTGSVIAALLVGIAVALVTEGAVWRAVFDERWAAPAFPWRLTGAAAAAFAVAAAPPGRSARA